MTACADRVLEVIRHFRTCEMTTLSRAGGPATVPVSPVLLDDGRLFLGSSIGSTRKVENIRRCPRVSMLFSDPTGSGLQDAGAVLVQGEAVAEDRIVADVAELPELRAAVATMFARQPSGAFMSSFVGRRLFPTFYAYVPIYVTPHRIRFWPTDDFGAEPETLDVREVQRVG